MTKASRHVQSTSRRVRGSLAVTGLASDAVHRYCSVIAKFLFFLRTAELTFPRSSEELDLRLAAYVESLCLVDLPQYRAGDVVSAFCRFLPEVRLQLPRSIAFLSTWSRTLTAAAGRCLPAASAARPPRLTSSVRKCPDRKEQFQA